MGVDISISIIKMLSVQAEGTALVRARGLGPLMPMKHQKLREGQISLKVTQQVEGSVWT